MSSIDYKKIHSKDNCYTNDGYNKKKINICLVLLRIQII